MTDQGEVESENHGYRSRGPVNSSQKSISERIRSGDIVSEKLGSHNSDHANPGLWN